MTLVTAATSGLSSKNAVKGLSAVSKPSLTVEYLVIAGGGAGGGGEIFNNGGGGEQWGHIPLGVPWSSPW